MRRRIDFKGTRRTDLSWLHFKDEELTDFEAFGLEDLYVDSAES